MYLKEYFYNCLLFIELLLGKFCLDLSGEYIKQGFISSLLVACTLCQDDLELLSMGGLCNLDELALNKILKWVSF